MAELPDVPTVQGERLRHGAAASSAASPARRACRTTIDQDLGRGDASACSPIRSTRRSTRPQSLVAELHRRTRSTRPSSTSSPRSTEDLPEGDRRHQVDVIAARASSARRDSCPGRPSMNKRCRSAASCCSSSPALLLGDAARSRFSMLGRAVGAARPAARSSAVAARRARRCSSSFAAILRGATRVAAAGTAKAGRRGRADYGVARRALGLLLFGAAYIVAAADRRLRRRRSRCSSRPSRSTRARRATGASRRRGDRRRAVLFWPMFVMLLGVDQPAGMAVLASVAAHDRPARTHHGPLLIA